VPTIDWFPRLAVIVAGVLGASGIAAAAGASHAGDASILVPLSLIALTQAPAVLALGLHAAATRFLRLATAVIAVGALIFVADLAARHFTGTALFPLAAPVGGGALILGWLLLIPAAFTLRRP